MPLVLVCCLSSVLPLASLLSCLSSVLPLVLVCCLLLAACLGCCMTGHWECVHGAITGVAASSWWWKPKDGANRGLGNECMALAGCLGGGSAHDWHHESMSGHSIGEGLWGTMEDAWHNSGNTSMAVGRPRQRCMVVVCDCWVAAKCCLPFFVWLRPQPPRKSLQRRAWRMLGIKANGIALF